MVYGLCVGYGLGYWWCIIRLTFHMQSPHVQVVLYCTGRVYVSRDGYVGCTFRSV